MSESMGFLMRIKYVKSGRLAFLSHLETIRSMERIIRRAGLPYAVTEGFNGLHFAPGDAAALAQAVRRLDTVRFDRTAIRAEAAIRISPEENYQTLMQIYRAAGANP